ncbi:MAG: universal stress protein [Actinomycetota bacterium]|nr:universal stress protein [Actinomycetota bacterium]
MEKTTFGEHAVVLGERMTGLQTARVPTTYTQATVANRRAAAPVSSRVAGSKEPEMSDGGIVVGVDGSPASYTGLRWAMVHAGHIGGHVRAVRCWQPVSVKSWRAAVTAEPVPPSAEQYALAERELAQVVAAAALGQAPEAAHVAVQRRVARGAAGSVLVTEAEGAALLVVGSHGHRRIHDVLAESTSSYCVRHATCPVVVITSAIATRRMIGAKSSTRGFGRVEAMRHLPDAYSLALRLREAGLADDLIAECLAVERQALNPLFDVADEKLVAAVGGGKRRPSG